MYTLTKQYNLEGDVPILVYRVADYAKTLKGLRQRGLTGGTELEIPHGPCFSFSSQGGQRMAIYELVRPEANAMFAGRNDP